MNRMCEKMEQLIIDYALDELEESEKHIVEQHVQACSECAEALEETRRIAAGVSRSEMLEPSVSVCGMWHFPFCGGPLSRWAPRWRRLLR
jgi:hypothetical protein